MTLDLTGLGNLDFSAVGDIDEVQVQTLCREVQQRLQGEYVIELGPLRSVATAVLPLLDQREETQPYAAWLRARLDYFEIADELRLIVPPPQLTLQPAPLPPIQPAPDLERRVWQDYLRHEAPPGPAARWVPRLKPIFTEEQVPPALVWLAEVESGFNPRARSPVGAVGLYQLMPFTAELVGLNLGPADERLDPEKNARGAAQYLKYLHGKFRDWRLSLAAYNAGEGRVWRLMEKHGARDYDRIALELPAETQLYVPKVEATLLRREGIALTELSLAPAMP